MEHVCTSKCTSALHLSSPCQALPTLKPSLNKTPNFQVVRQQCGAAGGQTVALGQTAAAACPCRLPLCLPPRPFLTWSGHTDSH